MILIADSGSFKTNWRILKDERMLAEFNTMGLNPYFTGSEEIQKEIKTHFPEEIRFEAITAIYFYGAGCGSPEKGKIVEEALKAVFSGAFVEVNTDLLAAARACFGKKQGIIVILGTGSNNGFYDGQKITRQVPSLGFILGDEGSGAQLGKKLISAFLLGELPVDLNESFINQYKPDRNQILDQLYSKPRPNRFLASFIPFLWWHRKHEFVNRMVTNSFGALIQKYLMKFPEFTQTSTRFTGSVAHFFEEELTMEVAKAGGRVDCILQHPIDRLAEYHLTNK